MSQELDIIEGHAEPVLAPPAPINLFGTEDPREVVTRASAHAAALADVIRQKKLSASIQGREHVLVEGWTLLGSMLGVFPVCVWTHKLENPEGWEARVEARTLGGQVVGAAEAECLRAERTWKDRDDYALRSMAQTRATSKALRAPLGFIVQLAGFNATPAEEMPTGEGEASDTPITKPQQRLIFARARENAVSDDELKEIIRTVAGVDSTAAIPRSKLDAVLEAIANDIPFG